MPFSLIKRIIAFKNAFHGRTSAAVAATDNQKISSPLNLQQEVSFLPFNDVRALEIEISKGDVCAVIFEAIQGVGGLDEPEEDFVYAMERLCKSMMLVSLLTKFSLVLEDRNVFAFQNTKSALT